MGQTSTVCRMVLRLLVCNNYDLRSLGVLGRNNALYPACHSLGGTRPGGGVRQHLCAISSQRSHAHAMAETRQPERGWAGDENEIGIASELGVQPVVSMDVDIGYCKH